MSYPAAKVGSHERTGLRDDIRGVAAVEFALILPLMFMLYLGVSEVSRAIRASQKVDQIARFIADMTARKTTGGPVDNQATITNADLLDFSNAAKMLIAPLAKENLLIEIDEIKTGDLTQATTPKVMWVVLYNPSRSASNRTIRRPCGPLNQAQGVSEFEKMPAHIAYSEKGDSYLIAARVRYDYGTSGFQSMLGRLVSMTQWSYAVPRVTPSSTSINPIILTASFANNNGVRDIILTDRCGN